MLRSRIFALLAALIALVALSGCEPAQLEIDFTIRNTGIVTTTAAGQRQMVLTGVLACSKGTPGAATSEPLDLFATVVQGDLRHGVELHDRCSEPRVWFQVFDVDPAFGAGPVRVEIVACTNPGFALDEDCEQATEVVTLTDTSAR